MDASKLSHRLGPEGAFPSDFQPSHTCLTAIVPGDPARQVIVLRSREAVLNAFRNSKLRSLHEVDDGFAIGGVTLQHPEGLLRRDPPETDIRHHINRFFSKKSVEVWRTEISEVARTLAVGLPHSQPFDIAADFCERFVADASCLTTGLSPGEWLQLRDCSDRTTGALVESPLDPGPVRQAWKELYDFCAPVIEREREKGTAFGPSCLEHIDPASSVNIVTQVVFAMDQQQMSHDAVLHACTTVLNGFPTAIPAMKTAAFELLCHTDIVQESQEHPEAWPAIVHELLRSRAHFGFGLPGVALEEFEIDGFVVKKGAVVLPAIHAAEHDPAYWTNPDKFEIRHEHAASLAFGAGVHVCPGKELSLLMFEEAFKELFTSHPGLRFATDPLETPWLEGTMPTPAHVTATDAAS